MVYIISVISSLFLSIRKNEKQVLLSILFVVYMALLMGVITPSHSFDTYAYQITYGWTPASHRFEPGYLWLTYIFYKIGIPYVVFRIIYYTSSMLILWWAVKRFNGNLLTYFSIFSIYPFLIEMTQVRNFGMIALIALALSFINERTKKSTIIGILLILLSVTIQSSGMLFLLALPFFWFVKGEKLQKIVERGYLITAFLYLLFHYFVSAHFFENVVLLIFKLTGRSMDVSEGRFGSGSSFSVVLGYIVFFGILVLIWKKMLQAELGLLNDSRFKIIYSVLVVSMIAQFLMFATVDFERYIRDGFTLSLIAFSIYEREHITKYETVRKFWLPIAVILIIASVVYHYWTPGNTGRLQYLIYLIQLFPNINWA